MVDTVAHMFAAMSNTVAAIARIVAAMARFVAAVVRMVAPRTQPCLRWPFYEGVRQNSPQTDRTFQPSGVCRFLRKPLYR